MSEDKTRIEKDSMGGFEVPENAMYGASTARAVENFQISDLRFKRSFIKALGEIKRACAIANEKNKLLDKKIADQIVKSAELVSEGEFDDDFVVDIFQTGSGTSTNMNVNEIIARHASLELGEDIHPNDHVNMSQSSNDVIPTATNIAVVEGLEKLYQAKTTLERELDVKVEEFGEMYKNGRTHLMDATPVDLGTIFNQYTSLIRNHSFYFLTEDEDLDSIAFDVRTLTIGGTAVGSGINAPDNHTDLVVQELNKRYVFSDSGAKFSSAINHFAQQGSRDEIVKISGELKALAVSLYKIANDIRWMGSGPVSGLGELKLPSLQPGSSIMPGKVNPVIPEMMMQVAAQVIGNDTTVTFAGTQGNFELNTMLPVMAHNVLESIEILTTGMDAFAEKCIKGLEANTEKMLENVEKNPVLVTALVPKLGYDVAAEIAKEAMESDKTIKEIVLNKGLMTDKEVDEALDISKLV